MGKRRGQLQQTTCTHPGCGESLIFARLAEDTRQHIALLVEPVPAESTAAAVARVVVGPQAWRPGDLLDHFRATFPSASDNRVRDLVATYEHHLPHSHPDTGTDPLGDIA